MATYSITIKTDNAAFADDPAPEIARILRRLADRLEADGVAPERVLFDVNGNRVGEAGMDYAADEDWEE